jgi:hypothetical protein
MVIDASGRSAAKYLFTADGRDGDDVLIGGDGRTHIRHRVATISYRPCGTDLRN